MKITSLLIPYCLLMIVCLSGCTTQQVITDLADIIDPSAAMEKLDHEPFLFTEGPAADTEGNIYFTDVRASRIYKYSAAGVFTVFRENTNACNGLMFNHDGELIGCEGGAARLVAMGPDGSVLRVLADSHAGHALNSPNDLIIDRNGGIYFSDPVFGQRADTPPNVEGVYYLALGATEPVLVVDDVSKTNGVMLSLDQNVLYVVNTFGDKIRAYRLEQPGVVRESGDFATMDLPDTPPDSNGIVRSGGDGLAIDALGNLYVTSSLGVQVFNVLGEHLGIIQVPEKPANCIIGGPEMDTLFITARTSLYAVKLKVKGVVLPVR